MKHFRYRGKRIRPADKDLMFRSACCVALPVSLAVFALLNLKSILQTDWRRLSMLGVDGIDLNMGYLMFSGIVAAVAAGAVLVLLYRLFPDTVRQLRHRQKLARMVLENQWYEQAERTKQDGFFKDLPRADTKPKIARFPRMYYRMENGLLHFQVEITMGKYQEPLLHLETKLESGLYCELVSRELRDGYVEYTLLYDMVANRIPIAEAKAEGGRLRLMKNVWWEYDTLPHMLIAGGTGGGKTYFTVIVAPLTSNLHRDKHLVTHVPVCMQGLPQYSVVLLEQIRTVDKARLGNFVGAMDKATLKKIDESALRSLGLTDGFRT